MKTIMIRKR